jgi:hypothetical protein
VEAHKTGSAMKVNNARWTIPARGSSARSGEVQRSTVEPYQRSKTDPEGITESIKRLGAASPIAASPHRIRATSTRALGLGRPALCSGMPARSPMGLEA